MNPINTLTLTLLYLSIASYVHGACEPETPFPAPTLSSDLLQSAFNEVQSSLNESIAEGTFNTTSFSLEISSSQETLFTMYHASNTPNAQGTAVVSGSSVYRIASNTKLFTSLGILQQQAKGNLNLDDLVANYVPGLLSNTTSQKIAWNQITIRTLMAHLSGIPDNYAESDLILSVTDPTAYGLPPVSPAQLASLPHCEQFSNYTSACTEGELLDDLHSANPVFPSKTEASYSNVGYDLLGLVLANVTGQKYEDYISSSIIKPLGLTDTSFSTPNDSVGVIPADSYWGVDLGVGNPSGGLYSSSSDMVKLLRYAMNNYNSITPALNWFFPATYSTGSHSYIGYPWEIFRTTSILPDNNRPVTFNTKGGGLTGYYSYSIVIPSHDLAIFMSVGGGSTALFALNEIFESVLDPLVLAAESIAQDNLNHTYAGQYTASPGLNSSLVISQSANQSLYIESWISNSTDVLSVFVPLVAGQAGTGDNLYFQLVPTFETRASSNSSILGEVWRFINVLNEYGESDNATTTWDDYCVANFDPLSYAGIPINEVVFWRNGNGTEDVESVELSAFRVTMSRA